jgi:hypothetical protein
VSNTSYCVLFVVSYPPTLATLGRGEYVRLLLINAGITFEYVRYSFPEEKSKLISQLRPAPTMLFIITTNRKHYNKTLPLISKKLNKYQGNNDDKNQLADAYTDAVMYWSTKSAIAFYGADEEAKKVYRQEVAPKEYTHWKDVLSESGFCLLGEEISYADVALYHTLKDDCNAQADKETYPHLAAFVNAVQNRLKNILPLVESKTNRLITFILNKTLCK